MPEWLDRHHRTIGFTFGLLVSAGCGLTIGSLIHMVL